MRALRDEDPVEVGGHRLVARLGAGGMGVVYLARSVAGELLAVKVIRAEHAADLAFRARFRREAALAERLRGRWTVRLRGADAEAREPWLATDFVPGPSLSEAVTAYGALPPRTVVTLGARIAEALSEVHTTGLVHRDVKPGNILLTRDGPRLIDFGIARGFGATALTSPEAIVGTPGYLSPEQTRLHGGEVGPASDLFSLGCVLAYGATGRAPYGSGDPVAVLYRTLHEKPDLTGLGRLPVTARLLVERCLSQDPEERPTAAELALELGDLGLPSDPRTTDERAAAPGQDPAPDWLPSGVLRLVAERSTRALDPPPRESAPERPEPEPEPTSRRRFLLWGGTASLAAAGASGALFLTRGSFSSSGEDLPLHVIGFHSDLSGPQRELGRAQERGARLAVEQHNSRTDKGFRLELRTADDSGSAERARAVARGLLTRGSGVRAVIGPLSDAALRAAEPLYSEARMAMVLVSCEGGGISTVESRTLYLTRGAEATQDLALIDYLTRVRSVSRTAVVQDLAAGPVARTLARELRNNPPSQGSTNVHQVAADTEEFGPVVADALATRPGAVVYAGTSPRRGARLARALADAGFTGARVGIEALMRPEFLAGAGSAAEGWVFSSPYTGPGTSPGAREFAAAHLDRYGTEPGRWAAEAYDAVGLIAQGLARLGDDPAPDPSRLADTLFRLPYDGVSKPLRVEQDTHVLVPERTLFLFESRGRGFRFLGRYDQVKAGGEER